MILNELKKTIEAEVGEKIDGIHRDRYLVYARAVFCKIAKAISDSEPKMTLQKIGEVINRDHSTVIYAINNTFFYAVQDSYWMSLYEELYDIFVNKSSVKPNRNSEEVQMLTSKVIQLEREKTALNKKLSDLRFEQGRFSDMIKDLDVDDRIIIYEKLKNFVEITKRLNAKTEKEGVGITEYR
jgi:hypothetical protein